MCTFRYSQTAACYFSIHGLTRLRLARIIIQSQATGATSSVVRIESSSSLKHVQLYAEPGVFLPQLASWPNSSVETRERGIGRFRQESCRSQLCADSAVACGCPALTGVLTMVHSSYAVSSCRRSTGPGQHGTQGLTVVHIHASAVRSALARAGHGPSSAQRPAGTLRTGRIGSVLLPLPYSAGLHPGRTGAGPVNMPTS
jgi:hypothetical protein